ncbi:MalY/PatB family protein [Pectobacterium brasiliense]|uniref:cysteine-S-conjugate beta-lyase n=1 Tax=Pectobacterium brasiliense TaxID=180957 RepID=A0AAW9H810_9GAMM|nr:MalY/PatB family protein [Pectobacterium brasiliense]MDY4376831.1 MalY/PatB family protein [Pectobacterium brasiliense]
MSDDFDVLIPRRGTNAVKWDAAAEANMLPMWVADMDFRTAPEVINALEARARHGIFGYTQVPSDFYTAIVNWFSRRHGFILNPQHLLYTTGVVPALSAVVRALTKPGEKVIVQTPVYNCFFSSVRNQGCEIITNPLVRNGDTYTINFDDLEQKATDPHARILLLCNPHNPVGRVWRPEELLRIGEICLRHNVIVIADEIHGDLVQPGFRYTPFASVSEHFMQNAITCISPSKAFNLAGLQVAAIHTANDDMRQKIDKVLNIHEVCEINPFAVEALIAAWNHGEVWLNALNLYLHDNYNYLKTFFNHHLPAFPVIQLEGTYLAWVDCHALPCSSAEITALLKAEEKLWVNEGTIYGEEGEHYIRLNFACPRSRLLDGLNKIKAAFERTLTQ